MLGIVSSACELAGLAGFAVAAFLLAGVPAVVLVGSAELVLIGFVLEPLPRKRVKRN